MVLHFWHGMCFDLVRQQYDQPNPRRTMLKNNFIKSTLATLLLGATFASNASLISVTFGGVTAQDNSGLTSQFIDPNQAASGQGIFGFKGYFIETFDSTTAMAGFGVGTSVFNHPTDNAGCAINSTAAGVTIGGTGSFEVRANSVNGVAAAPANDETCFAYTPAQGGAFGTVELNYASLLGNVSSQLGSTVGINYFGFYWGSVDDYNDFSFFSGDTEIGTLTGAFLLGELGGNTGNQTSDLTNVYVNVAFVTGASFDKVVINSTGVAGEIDNIVVGFDTPVPVAAPSTLAISGLALLGLAGLRRRK